MEFAQWRGQTTTTAISSPKSCAAKSPVTRSYEDDVALAFMGIMPQADGHVLALPKPAPAISLTPAPKFFRHADDRACKNRPRRQEALAADGSPSFNTMSPPAARPCSTCISNIVPRWTGLPLRPQQRTPERAGGAGGVPRENRGGARRGQTGRKKRAADHIRPLFSLIQPALERHSQCFSVRLLGAPRPHRPSSSPKASHPRLLFALDALQTAGLCGRALPARHGPFSASPRRFPCRDAAAPALPGRRRPSLASVPAPRRHDDPHRAAVLQAAEQDLVGQRRLDMGLDDPRHRPRAHCSS